MALAYRGSTMLPPIPMGEWNGRYQVMQPADTLAFDSTATMQYSGLDNPYTNVTPMTNFNQAQYLTPMIPTTIPGRLIGDSLLGSPVSAFY